MWNKALFGSGFGNTTSKNPLLLVVVLSSLLLLLRLKLGLVVVLFITPLIVVTIIKNMGVCLYLIDPRILMMHSRFTGSLTFEIHNEANSHAVASMVALKFF